MSIFVEWIPDLEQRGFTAWVPDIPAYGEGETEEEAIQDLREALVGHIDAFGLDEAPSRVNSPSIRRLDRDLAELTRGEKLPRITGVEMVRSVGPVP